MPCPVSIKTAHGAHLFCVASSIKFFLTISKDVRSCARERVHDADLRAQHGSAN